MHGGKITPIFGSADLKQIIEEVVHMQKMQADRVEIWIETKTKIENDVKIKFDAQRLQQVLTNLLSNAIKFSPSHSTITVKGKLKMQTGTEGIIVVKVSD